MIIEEIKNIKSGRGDLRKFGLALGVAFLLWIGIFTWHRKVWYPSLLLLPASLIFLACICPSALKLLHKALRVLFILINWIITRLTLCILFYLVITPISIISRLFGKKFLDSKINKKAESYWVLKENTQLDKKAYQNQF